MLSLNPKSLKTRMVEFGDWLISYVRKSVIWNGERPISRLSCPNAKTLSLDYKS
jgi:hypothetical protein